MGGDETIICVFKRGNNMSSFLFFFKVTQDENRSGIFRVLCWIFLSQRAKLRIPFRFLLKRTTGRKEISKDPGEPISPLNSPFLSSLSLFYWLLGKIHH